MGTNYLSSFVSNKLYNKLKKKNKWQIQRERAVASVQHIVNISLF